MSSISRLSQIVESAYKNEDVQLMRDTYREYQIANCYYPRLQRIYDAHTQTMRTIPVACGSCYHCIETKINEWVTRMYAHAEDFKHVYFITLTYRSFKSLDAESSKLIIRKLKDAIWHRDSINYNRSYSYNPCLLVKKHYQLFIKRLRKNTGVQNITYVLSGEYGHDYGRPHFHIILFSPDPIRREDVVRAWSVCLWRINDGRFIYRTNQKKDGQAYDFPIGRVDYNDLVTNGSFNTTAKIRVDGRYMDVGNCFAYVCKYVCKSDKANKKRLSLAYNALFNKVQKVDLFGNEVSFNIAKNWLEEHGYSPSAAIDIYNHLKSLTYEKTIFEPSFRVFADGVEQFECVKIFGHDTLREFYPSLYYEFSEKFSPFCEFSRGVPIGSIYAARNVQEFAQGVFTKPILQIGSYVVPAYFRIKAQEYLYGLRRLHKTIKSKSFNLGGLVNLYRCFQEYLQDGTPLLGYFDSKGDIERYKSALQDDTKVYYDKFTRERIILADGQARYYKYSRADRDYILTRTASLTDFVSDWYAKLKAELDRYNAQLLLAHSNEKIKEATFLKMLDCGLEYPSLRDRFVELESAFRKQKQIDYNQLHLFVE